MCSPKAGETGPGRPGGAPAPAARGRGGGGPERRRTRLGAWPPASRRAPRRSRPSRPRRAAGNAREKWRAEGAPAGQQAAVLPAGSSDPAQQRPYPGSQASPAHRQPCTQCPKPGLRPPRRRSSWMGPGAGVLTQGSPALPEEQAAPRPCQGPGWGEASAWEPTLWAGCGGPEAGEEEAGRHRPRPTPPSGLSGGSGGVSSVTAEAPRVGCVGRGPPPRPALPYLLKRMTPSTMSRIRLLSWGSAVR